LKGKEITQGGSLYGGGGGLIGFKVDIDTGVVVVKGKLMEKLEGTQKNKGGPYPNLDESSSLRANHVEKSRDKKK